VAGTAAVPDSTLPGFSALIADAVIPERAGLAIFGGRWWGRGVQHFHPRSAPARVRASQGARAGWSSYHFCGPIRRVRVGMDLPAGSPRIPVAVADG